MSENNTGEIPDEEAPQLANEGGEAGKANPETELQESPIDEDRQVEAGKENADDAPAKRSCACKICIGLSVFVVILLIAVVVWFRVSYKAFFQPACARPKRDIESLESLDACIEEIVDRYDLQGVSISIATTAGDASAAEGAAATWGTNYGFANIEEELKVTSDTPFLLSSISKTFIGTAIMQQVEAGVLDLDEDINTYLSFVVDNPKVDGEKITLRHLSTHTSGIYDYYEVYDASYAPGEPQEELGSFLEAYLVPGGRDYSAQENFLDCQPGECAYEYSNIGAALAAYVLESVLGQSFAQYVEDNILSPLQMTNSHYYLANYTDTSIIALPYEKSENGEELVTNGHYGYPTYPDGRLYTSSNDMSKYMVALMGSNDETLMSLETRADMFATQNVNQKSDISTKLFYGPLDQEIFWVNTNGNQGHDGGDYGSFTLMYFEPKQEVGIVVLANYADLNGAIGLMQIVKQVTRQGAHVAKLLSQQG